jgi:hypothetical protein
LAVHTHTHTHTHCRLSRQYQKKFSDGLGIRISTCGSRPLQDILNPSLAGTITTRRPTQTSHHHNNTHTQVTTAGLSIRSKCVGVGGIAEFAAAILSDRSRKRPATKDLFTGQGPRTRHQGTAPIRLPRHASLCTGYELRLPSSSPMKHRAMGLL